MTSAAILFHMLDPDEGFQAVPGYPNGITERILSGSLDQNAKRGHRTRLVRFTPGARTTDPFVHDYHEEVTLLSGDLTEGADANGEGGVRYDRPAFGYRPPGTTHGPFRSEDGCLLLETHWYNDAATEG